MECKYSDQKNDNGTVSRKKYVQDGRSNKSPAPYRVTKPALDLQVFLILQDYWCGISDYLKWQQPLCFICYGRFMRKILLSK